MRRNFIMCAVLMVAMILVPLATMQSGAQKNVKTNEDNTAYNGYISVMKSENGKVESLDETEYLKGVLAAEMPMDYHEEALKAQVVAAYTYALYLRESADEQALNGADISDSPAIHQGYLSVDDRKKKWGEKFEEYEKKAQHIVGAVSGVRMLYDGQPTVHTSEKYPQFMVRMKDDTLAPVEGTVEKDTRSNIHIIFASVFQMIKNSF